MNPDGSLSNIPYQLLTNGRVFAYLLNGMLHWLKTDDGFMLSVRSLSNEQIIRYIQLSGCYMEFARKNGISLHEKHAEIALDHLNLELLRRVCNRE